MINEPLQQGPWIHPSPDFPAEPRWGFADGIQLGIAPLGGPRGLLRIYAPYLDHPRDRLINFIAIEPIPAGADRRGYSELEPSRLDPERGKRFWSASSVDAPEIGLGDHPVPGELSTIDGELVTLSDLRGQVVWLNFWATWCRPCRQELPEIQVELVSTNEVSNLLRREADIAIRMTQPTTATVVARRIGRFALGAFAHVDYLRRRGTPRQTAELLRHDVLGYDRIDTIVRMSAQLGTPLQREDFCFRTDDMGAYWEALRQGMGIGFVSESLARTDSQVQRVLPQLKIPSLPVWLAVHREIRTDRRIRAVYDFLARNIPASI